MRNKKNILLLIITATLLLSCGKSYWLDKGDSYYPEIADFCDISGARAIATAKEPSENSRDAEDAVKLVKILEDGRIENLFKNVELDSYQLEQFSGFIKSPVTDDLFIIMNSSFWYNSEDFGQILRIKSDGTLKSVLPVEKSMDGYIINYYIDNYYNGTNRNLEETVEFDNEGNLYLIVSSSGYNDPGTTRICKYSIESESVEFLTPAIEGFSFSEFKISPDGTKAILSGNRSSWTDNSSQSAFCYLYDTSDMSNYKSVIYFNSQNCWNSEIAGIKFLSDSSLVCNFNNYLSVSGVFRIKADNKWSLDYSPVYYPLFNQNSGNSTIVKNSLDSFDPYNSHNFMVNDWLFRELRKVEMAVSNGTEIFYLSFDLDFNSNGSFDLTYNFTNEEFDYETMNLALDLSNPSIVQTVDNDEDLLSALNSNNIIMRFPVTTKWIADDLKKELVYNYIQGEDINILKKAMGKKSSYNDFYNLCVINSDLTYNDVSTLISSMLENDGAFTLNYDGKSGEEAWNSMVEDKYFFKSEVGKNGNSKSFFDNFISSDNIPDLEDVQFDYCCNSSAFFHKDDEANVWLISTDSYNGDSSAKKFIFTKVFDSSLNKDIIIHQLSLGYAINYKLCGSKFYYRIPIFNGNGIEAGAHKLFMVDLNDPSFSKVDVLANVPDNGNFEIIDFSADSENVYFTGLKGMGAVIGGSVSVADSSYSPFEDTSYRLSNIQVYNADKD